MLYNIFVSSRCHAVITNDNVLLLQSWGDHSDLVNAANLYVLLLLAVYVYCGFGEKLSHQVLFIWFLQTGCSERLPYSLFLMEYVQMTLRLCFLDCINN
jgi:hypothetical protein